MSIKVDKLYNQHSTLYFQGTCAGNYSERVLQTTTALASKYTNVTGFQMSDTFKGGIGKQML